MRQTKIKTTLGRAIILVEDYDKALDFYQNNFFCKKIYDQTTADGQRYLHISFSEDDGIGIWFLKTDTEEQAAKTGKQTMGQPTLVIYTETIEELYNHLRKNNVEIVGDLVLNQASKFFHCLDLYGNKLTIVELPN